MVGEPQAVGRGGGRAIDEMATETFASSPRRRARSNRVRSWIDVRLCADGEERRVRATDSRFGQEIFSGGQKFPAQLRAFRRGFSFAVSRRSRRDAARASTKRIRELVEKFHAANSGRPGRKRERGLVEGRGIAG